MILVKNKWFPFGNYKAINICGIVFYKGDNLSDKTINHEKIHTKQMIELLFIFFYLWYGIEYLIIRLFHKKQNDVYHDVSFEEEAHNNDDNLNYIDTRKHYAWFKYIKIKSNNNKIIAESNRELETFKKFQIAAQANPNLTYKEFCENINNK